jgi:NAD(P)-dependent dehydrogenase (short-subunit alcohol dehydrogenase family)
MSGSILGYEGKKVIVTGGGGAGMGAAAVGIVAGLGAEVHVLDFKEPPVPVASHQAVDLKDPEAMSAAIGNIGGGIDALFNCVGVPGNRTSDLDTFLINFAGVRHLTDEVVKRMNDGGAVATIASNAGENWERSRDAYQELVATKTFAEAAEWFQSHPELLTPGKATSAYRVSKEAANAWSILAAPALGERGIRQNAVMPGFTETPMGAEFRDVLGAGYFEEYPTPLGRYLKPEEPAKAMVFLNSNLASGITGISILVDGGAAAVLKSAPLTV